jgi:hypothetical protein
MLATLINSGWPFIIYQGCKNFSILPISNAPINAAGF